MGDGQGRSPYSSPYDIAQRRPGGAGSRRGVRSLLRSAAGMIAYLLFMAALALGMIWLLWKVSGK